MTARLAPALLAILFVAASARADDVEWRRDYAAARREAAASGRPLFLDFGTENCIWCRRLDASTLREPEVVRRLNSRFIPVKIDGHEQPQLAEALGITGYPTLVVASPDGAVRGRHNGYADAARFLALLDRADRPGDDGERRWERIRAGLDSLHAEIAARLTADTR